MSPLTREIGEFGTLLAIDRAKQLLGYEPRLLLARRNQISALTGGRPASRECRARHPRQVGYLQFGALARHDISGAEVLKLDLEAGEGRHDPRRAARRGRAVPRAVLRHQPGPVLGRHRLALRPARQPVLARAARCPASPPRQLKPSEQDELTGYGLGITNIAPRATAQAAELTAAELRDGGAQRLADLIARPPPPLRRDRSASRPTAPRSPAPRRSSAPSPTAWAPPASGSSQTPAASTPPGSPRAWRRRSAS